MTYMLFGNTHKIYYYSSRHRVLYIYIQPRIKKNIIHNLIYSFPYTQHQDDEV